MSPPKRISLLISGGAVALMLIAAIAAFLFVDINTFKSSIESAAFEATGLDVRINGKMGLSFFPLRLSAKDIHVTSKAGEIISLENINLRAELMPLLKKQLKVTSCELVNPVVTIVKDLDGIYNFAGTQKNSTEGEPRAAFSLNDLKLSKGMLVHLDKKTGEKTEFRDFNLAVRDLSIEGDFLKNSSFSGSFDCKEVRQKDFRIVNLKATVKGGKGAYTFDPVTIGALVIFDRKSGEKAEFNEVNLAIRDLSLDNLPGDIIKHVSFTGTLDCKSIRKRNLKIDNVKGSIKAEKGLFSLNSLTMDIFGAQGEGDATLDKSKVDTMYKLNVKIAKLDFEEFEHSFNMKKMIGGKGDLLAAVTMREKERHRLVSSLDGTFSLRGDNLIIYGMDLDKVLSTYATSQEFNLVDLGAFFIAGPFSTFAVRGYRSGDLFNQTREGKGVITHFNSHWKIKNGVADATDCALATRHNRVALKGRLDLVNERYDNVVVALLDEQGCAKFKQSISGSIREPEFSAVSAAKSLAGPFSNLYRKAIRFVQGGKCEVMYNGSVQQPPQ